MEDLERLRQIVNNVQMSNDAQILALCILKVAEQLEEIDKTLHNKLTALDTR